MKITKAIELLQQDIDDHGSLPLEDICEAEKLGIEALMIIKLERLISNFKYYVKLPGETDE